jgi:tetratricopeptide (TPR) repeat protein
MKFYLAPQSYLFLGLILASVLSFATSNENDADSLFQQAQLLYDDKDYESALPVYQKAVALAPMMSTYHHMLGKCYGRIAEEGSWLTALRYVRKTLAEFKKAVELDDNNMQAWIDLEEFYRRAPGFLGGNKAKAKEIRQRLADLDAAKGTEKPDIAAPEVP